MTVSSTSVSSGPFVPDGVTTTFPVSHPTISSTEIEVRIDDAVVSSLLYTFDRDDDGTGEVIFTVAPTGSELVIYSKPNFLQPTEFERFAPMFPDQINPPLDAAAIRDLYLLDQIQQIPEIDIADEVIQAETARLDAQTARLDAQTARLDAQTARDAAALSAQAASLFAATAQTAIHEQFFDTAAEGISNGVAAITSLVGGSGGTNGTFDVAFTGGGGTGAAARFVVAGGAVTSATVTAPGKNYTSAPTVSFAASAGLTGASATAVLAQHAAPGEYFLVKGAGDAYADLYKNDAGSARRWTMRPTRSLPKTDQSSASCSIPFLALAAFPPASSNRQITGSAITATTMT
jgi:hypothetical protein